MFVPVSCTSCGKPFQVPETALGQLTPCPWCQAVVMALPVSAPPQPSPQAVPEVVPATQPLSLDDEPAESPPRAVAVKPPANTQRKSSSRTPSATRPWVILVALALSGFLLVGMMAATLLYLNYGRGTVSEGGWHDFSPPDGSFTIELPGTPTEEDVNADPANSLEPGKRFVVKNWYSKTSAWVTYNGISSTLVQKLPADKDRVFSAGVLRAERDRELNRLKGTITKEAEVRIGSAWGVVVHMDTPNGMVIEWIILVGTGPHPRLYAFGVEGKTLTPESVACQKLFTSFRLNE